VASMGVMDVVPSVSVAAGLYGYSSGHAFVHLAQILQGTCIKIQTVTNGEILIAATICRGDIPGGMLLFGSGYVNGTQQGDPSPANEAAVSIGVDSISSALRRSDEESRESGGPGLFKGLPTMHLMTRAPPPPLLPAPLSPPPPPLMPLSVETRPVALTVLALG